MPQTHTTPTGTAVTVPAYTDIADGPKAFIEFADSLTAAGMKAVQMTQAAYDLLAVKDPNTLYVIQG